MLNEKNRDFVCRCMHEEASLSAKYDRGEKSEWKPRIRIPNQSDLYAPTELLTLSPRVGQL